MEFNFFTAEDLLFHGELPSPIDVLRQSHWKLDDYNAPFLVGKVKKLDHSYGLLSDEEVESRYNPKLKMGNPETDDEKKIVGDISDGLKPSSEVIIADVRNFIKAEETAKQLGYRPAKAGEFLQMLWYLRTETGINHGLFYCYYGRVPNYAILACFDRRAETAGIREIIFDTHYDDLSCMGGNMESICFFAKDSE